MRRRPAVAESPHFLSVADLEDAEDHLGWVPIGHRVPHEARAVRIHVRDYRGRQVVPTLETFYDGFVLAQQRPGSLAAVRLALEETYGPDRVPAEVVGTGLLDMNWEMSQIRQIRIPANRP